MTGNEQTDLIKFLSDLLDVLSACPDDQSVEPVLNHDVPLLLVFLGRFKEEEYLGLSQKQRRYSSRNAEPEVRLASKVF